MIYSVEEVAQKLQISGRRVRKLLSEGRLKGKRLGNAWVVLSLDYHKKPEGRPPKNDSR